MEHFWATVCTTVHSVLYGPSSFCLFCLSVTLVYCDQTVGWVRMPLGVVVGLGPGHIVLDGDPAPLPRKGYSPLPSFRPMSIVAKRMDGSEHHATLVRRYRLRPSPHCVRWRHSSPTRGKGHSNPQFFGACLACCCGGRGCCAVVS